MSENTGPVDDIVLNVLAKGDPTMLLTRLAVELLPHRANARMLVEREKAAREADDAGDYDAATLIRMGR